MNSGLIEEVDADEYQEYQDFLHVDTIADKYDIELVVDETITELL